MKRILLLLAIVFFLLAWGAASGLFGLNLGNLHWPSSSSSNTSIAKSTRIPDEKVRVVQEESVVIDVAERVSPSVVTIGIEKTQKVFSPFQVDPYDPFGTFRAPQGSRQQIKQDIGSGFIVSADGLIITSKHVVDDAEAKYNVVTRDDKKYEVKKIYRDPANDLAVLQIGASGLHPVEMGDSTNLKVGQMVIAIGTALGEFRHTVTTGVISGLGRGITAGSPYDGFVERLDDVIQTDAAINPGNSGGPLLNSSGQVIGVNSAVAAGGQNIGFAIPINVIKDALKTFQSTGKFARSYIGVRYKMISLDLALLNEVPEGAYVQDVVDGSPASKAGIEAGDIITKFDGVEVKEKGSDLSSVIKKKKIGDKVKVDVWRKGQTLTKELVLEELQG